MPGNLVRNTEDYGLRARRDRSIQSGRVVSVNATTNTAILDVGMVDNNGNPVYMTDVPFTPQSPPSFNDVVSIERTSSSAYSMFIGGGGQIGGGNSGQVVSVDDGWIFKEAPSGSKNSSNKVFTLTYVPVTGSDHVFLNGLLQQAGGDDYTISDETITFTVAPDAADKLVVTYQKSGRLSVEQMTTGGAGGGGGCSVFDTFTDSDGTNLTDHTMDSGHEWMYAAWTGVTDGMVIESNVAMPGEPGLGFDNEALCTQAAASFNQTVEIDWTPFSGADGEAVYLLARHNNDPDSHVEDAVYAGYSTVSGQWVILTQNGTVVGVSEAVTDHTTYRLMLVTTETDAKLYVDSVLKVTSVDSVIATLPFGYVGFQIIYSGITPGTYVDNFSASIC